ncbi:MAG: hypothetical protein ACKVOL_09515 [Novosphingobium sp.]
MLLGAIFTLLLFARDYGERKRVREVRPLLFANSRISANHLADCLATGMPLTARWEAVNAVPHRIAGWNTARGLRIEIIDAVTNGRRIEIATLGARPLRGQEAEALRRCLAGG